MNSTNKTSRVLGVAFLIQFVTSLTNGIIRVQALIVPGNINETIIKITNNIWFMKFYILGEMLTAVGVIFLGVVLFATLKKHNEIMALTAMGCYILEGALLAASSMYAFSLLHISLEYTKTGLSSYLQTIGNLVLESMNFVYTPLMVAFCIGAILFYYLLFKSRIVPRALSLWGLITVFICLIATFFVMFGYKVSFIVYIPYIPFEFVIGIWILIKGLKGQEQVAIEND